MMVAFIKQFGEVAGPFPLFPVIFMARSAGATRTPGGSTN
jgi:hypothetical protein